jgi:hypothetical protein
MMRHGIFPKGVSTRPAQSKPNRQYTLLTHEILDYEILQWVLKWILRSQEAQELCK